MIGRLAGILVEKNPPQVVIDVQGIGYELDVPMSTFYNLPENGEKLALLTHFVVREDGHFLYGFASEAERFAFRQLLKISGVGARLALSVLSGLSVGDLAQVVARQEVGRLTRVPGIGTKTAERLLLELKGKLADALPTSAPAADSSHNDILNALLALGYNEREAGVAMKQLPADTTTSDGIRQALKLLSRV
ncbi:MAG: Holliday junction branch migration protein RuvA [Candidatus Accumulibacter sp.]|uniref:Holliday junction branch migration protein RuvA n=1 Tax=Accumulibacter sp. TaxID=2053492 RepID=UPI0019DEE8A3|nr:Holliday junction branch migration protein RuvA [Accumulibacter sp.]MBE2258756.1 Holliday junction branch migration protein RuvA [Paracoccaceae bacterium]MCB1941428.1 Holliday junction branch migration protein RuvA [Accumulibacter sp.]MCP5247019.1 Holliday junction branch migration protein RuvA [Accumulibacter sp.]